MQATWLRKQGQKGYAWDSHRENFEALREDLIPPFDWALNALITDLEERGQLDETLVVVAGEFGRPPEFDAGGGRGHWSKAFSVALAGGGLKTGQAIGVTDELGKLPLERPVSVPDLHATIHCALGIRPNRNLYDGDRPVPITDMGEPVREIFG